MKYWLIILGLILTSLYFFPFDIFFLPGGINTKQLMALVSLVIVGINLAKKRTGDINIQFLFLCIFAASVSLTTYASVVYNNTTDFTYVTYIISMLVWLGGAYTLIMYLKRIHGYVSVWLITKYLIGVCVAQCIIAIALSRSEWFFNFVNTWIYPLQGLDDFADGRLYGIGCAFDVAGMKMAAVLVLMGFFFPRVIKEYIEKSRMIMLYVILFLTIFVLGSMIARTTTIGMIIGALYILIYYISKSGAAQLTTNIFSLWGKFLALFVVLIAVIIFLYNTNDFFYKNFRFAFEGFFGLIETGRWTVSSNDALMTMYRFPETFKTWIIGDGYIFDTTLDPYYTGLQYKEYYMGIDVGYLRFIYYSGLLGLSAFVVFMCKSAQVCATKMPKFKILFLLLLVLQFAVWLKVASDIFVVFAIFLAIGFANDGENELLKIGDYDERVLK